MFLHNLNTYYKNLIISTNVNLVSKYVNTSESALYYDGDGFVDVNPQIAKYYNYYGYNNYEK